VWYDTRFKCLKCHSRVNALDCSSKRLTEKNRTTPLPKPPKQCAPAAI